MRVGSGDPGRSGAVSCNGGTPPIGSVGQPCITAPVAAPPPGARAARRRAGELRAALLRLTAVAVGRVEDFRADFFLAISGLLLSSASQRMDRAGLRGAHGARRVTHSSRPGSSRARSYHAKCSSGGGRVVGMTEPQPPALSDRSNVQLIASQNRPGPVLQDEFSTSRSEGKSICEVPCPPPRRDGAVPARPASHPRDQPRCRAVLASRQASNAVRPWVMYPNRYTRSAGRFRDRIRLGFRLGGPEFGPREGSRQHPRPRR